MAHAAHKNLYSSTISEAGDDQIITINELADNRDNLFNFPSGELQDTTKVRIKVSDEERQAIALLQQHYGAKLGKDITLSELINILIYKNLQETFSLDFTALKTALNAGLSVKIPPISVGFTAPVIGSEL